MRLKFIFLSLMCLLNACTAIVRPKENYIVPGQDVRAEVRIAYQMGMKHKLETRVHIAEALLSLEKELHIRIDVVAETEFPVALPSFDENTPKELIPDLLIENKLKQCGALQPNDGPALFCVFEGQEIVVDTFAGGSVLGVQTQNILIVANINDRELFLNVLRHEIGHLLGAPHDKAGLMKPFLGKEARKYIIGFSDGSVEGIRKRMIPALH